MDCRAVRERLMAIGAPPLEAAEQADVAAHVDGCEGCRHAIQIDQALNRAMGQVARHPAPAALRERIGARLRQADVAMPTASGAPTVAGDGETAANTTRAARRGPPRIQFWRFWSPVWSAAAIGACVSAALVLVLTRPGLLGSSSGAASDVVREAVNDHLRVVNSVHPIEIESGGIHQVKPWFTGRLEFAPRVAFSGDGDFTLLGGSVGYFHDRRAALFSFKRRLHTITLVVVQHAGLSWPDSHPKSVGPLAITEETSRGFSLLFWRAGDLGYVLISDVNPKDLEMLAGRLDRE